MIFWDTSALIPLLVEEPASPRVWDLVEQDPSLLVWWGTPVECLSAIARRERAGAFDTEAVDRARRLLRALEERWSEVLATEPVREHAARILRRHPVPAADAFQLAAALTWARGRPSGHRFATLDDRVSRAARTEGFEVPF